MMEEIVENLYLDAIVPPVGLEMGLVISFVIMKAAILMEGTVLISLDVIVI